MHPLIPLLLLSVSIWVLYLNKDYLKSLIKGLQAQNKSDTLDQELVNKEVNQENAKKQNELEENDNA